jgi:hypothetical protein
MLQSRFASNHLPAGHDWQKPAKLGPQLARTPFGHGEHAVQSAAFSAAENLPDGQSAQPSTETNFPGLHAPQ